jgi:hypothetical protein
MTRPIKKKAKDLLVYVGYGIALSALSMMAKK